jgi:hypothetical protein
VKLASKVMMTKMSVFLASLEIVDDLDKALLDGSSDYLFETQELTLLIWFLPTGGLLISLK